MVVVLLLILSLAGLTLLRSTNERFFVFLIDNSLSVGQNGAEKIEKFLDESLTEISDEKVAFLPFGAQVGTIRNERSSDDLRKKRETPSADETRTTGDEDADVDNSDSDADQIGPTASLPVDSSEENEFQDGTDIAAAIEAAAGYIPPGYLPHIVLITDGNETIGDSLSAASRSRVPVSTIPLPTRSEPEVQISEVSVPAEVREGEPFFVEVVIHSNHDDEGMVEIYRGDHKVIGETRKLKVGENRFRFQQSIDRARLASYTVRVSQLNEDTLLDNNLDSGLVYAAGKPRVLIIESDPNLIRDLAYALEEEGVESDVRPPQGMPETLSDLQNYELLVLSNVPATSLSQQQMEIARTFVQELGGGFIMLGGEQSFGLGGYYKSALEEILPVRSDFEKEKENPSLGMVLVIDKSGSMSGDKIEMAKSAARGAAELLGRRDKLGVIAFDGQSYVISEMQSASNKGKISDEIARIDAGGGNDHVSRDGISV